MDKILHSLEKKRAKWEDKFHANFEKLAKKEGHNLKTIDAITSKIGQKLTDKATITTNKEMGFTETSILNAISKRSKELKSAAKKSSSKPFNLGDSLRKALK